MLVARVGVDVSVGGVGGADGDVDVGDVDAGWQDWHGLWCC